MNRSLLCMLLTVCMTAAEGQTPEWSTTIASIIYDNCSECHHEGNIAPFSLMSYNDAVANGFSIQAAVNSHKMPPWPADPSYNHFWDERVLSESDITAINDWVNAGMPSGDLGLAPAPPVYNGAILMSSPDDTIILPAYTIPTDLDDYRTFVIHSGYTETKFINEIEFVPGDPSTVHHGIFNEDTSDIPFQKDLDDPLPGYTTTGFGDPSPTSINFGGWTPGKGLFKFPPNMGFEILPGSDFVISLHYAPGNLNKVDSSKIYLKFCDLPDSAIRRVYPARYLFDNYPSLINGQLQIPANSVQTFYGQSIVFGSKKSLVGLTPHSHWLCKSWEVFMVNPTGDTTKLLYIPQWDFNWQYNYMLTKVMMIPAGAQLFDEVVFDNTINNPVNPNNPPVDVHQGESTEDEMMNCRFWVMDYQQGDTSIILDSAFYGLGIPTPVSSVRKELSLQISPNPVQDILHFKVDNLSENEVLWTLTNALSNPVKSNYRNNPYKDIYTDHIDVSDLPGGMYILSLLCGKDVVFRKVSVIR